ncbi:hypothetical protein PR202_ga11322 [Eleusine coracana subsp. coracana]|uniref:GATA-type domain-containing protein n=1 Tax=Eleusine coracana subsp. coracana TaxID=191504 RepID=A0AAV5C979_ELECO|nr:hypothetical protein PR202_ga11322 [Eleusine coracana subsp. coracana]
MDFSEHKVIGIGVVVPEERRPFCVECRTTATPMWRGGPTGPRSLCNACGIRYRKKRRQELGLDNKQQPKQQAQQQQQLGQLQLQPPQQEGHQNLQRDLSEVTSAVKDSNSSTNTNTKSSSLQVVKKRRVLMGVEEAAILLMALSSSSRSPTLLHG